MKIIVTGGAGFIGSHTTDELINRGHEVIVIDDLSAGREDYVNPKAELHKIDICDYDEIYPLFSGVDYVIHLAAIPRVPVSVEDPIGTSKVNVMGTINIFKSALDHGVKRVVFASSSSIYGDQDILPITEDMSPNPVSPYGLQKRVCEEYAILFSKLYNAEIMGLRYFNVYGPRTDFSSDYSLVLGKFLKQQRDGKPFTIYGDGEQTRGFCYISDVVDANMLAMESDKLKGGEMINIGAKACSVNYLCDLLGGEKEYLSKRVGDAMHTDADTTKAKELLNWESKVSFEEGVEKTKEWFYKNES